MWFLSHNIPKRDKQAEKNSQKNPEYKQQWTIEEISILVTAVILNGGRGCRTQFWKGPTQGPSLPDLI
jgi:hypothetical protein